MTITFKAIKAKADDESPEFAQTVTAWHATDADGKETGEIVFAGVPSNFLITAEDAERLAAYIIPLAIVTDADGVSHEGTLPVGSDGSEPVDLENLPDKEPAKSTKATPAK